MTEKHTETTGVKQSNLFGTCPYCLRQIDVLFDFRGKPYWRCGRCDVRTFGTRTALQSLRNVGWIWEEERPLVELRAWLKRVAEEIGLTTKGKK
jgi:hypothetical protein